MIRRRQGCLRRAATPDGVRTAEAGAATREPSSPDVSGVVRPDPWGLVGEPGALHVHVFCTLQAH